MSAKEVAEWMLEYMGDSYWLYQETVVYKIKDKFGTDYVYQNQGGNLAIGRNVLKAFRNLTEGMLVWERGERAWRPKRKHDREARGVAS